MGLEGQALARAAQLAETGERLPCAAVVALGERAVGRCLMATGDPGGAEEHLGRALVIFARLELPFETARARLLLAQALSAARPQVAVMEARSALDAFERLGAGGTPMLRPRCCDPSVSRRHAGGRRAWVY